MPEKLMRWNGSEWVEVSLIRKEVEPVKYITAFDLYLYQMNRNTKLELSDIIINQIQIESRAEIYSMDVQDLVIVYKNLVKYTI